MGGTRGTLRAKTKTELRKAWSKAAQQARAQGLYPDNAFNPKKAKKAADGHWEIVFTAHT